MAALGHGPLHRSARTGAILLLVGAVEFIVAMIVTQLAYSNYSLSTNVISDLGNTATSPLWFVFSAAIILLGVLAFIAIFLLWNTFPAGGLRVVGLTFLLIASIAAVVVGFVPENVNGTVHGAAALSLFLTTGLGLLALGSAMGAPSGWGALRWPTVGLGVVNLVLLGLLLFTDMGAHQYPGLFERMVVAPILLWGILVALFLMRFPIRARGISHLVPGA